MSVCYKLRREIEDLFPPGTGPAERLTGLEIAEFGRQSTRISLIPLPVLCSRTGLSEDGVKKALQRLLARGLQFRIALTTGRDGRPVYAANGRDVQYRVPDVSEFEAAWKSTGGVLVALPEGRWSPVDNPVDNSP